jgi:hypothetical protein
MEQETAPSKESNAAGPGNGAAELAKLADELVNEIAAARRRNAELREVVDASASGKAAPAADEAAADEHADEQAADPVAHAQPPAPEDEAQLAVLSMALAGNSREAARDQLRESFGVENPDELLDRTYGADDGKRRRRFVRLRRGRD